MKLIGWCSWVRYKDEILEVGDLAIHGEEAFPEETLPPVDGAFALPPGESVLHSDRSEPSPPPDAGS